MKKQTLVSLICCSVLFTARAQVSFYGYPCSLPNDADNGSFPIARTTVMNGLVLGGNPIATASRANNPAGVELKSNFEAGDAMVVTPGNTTNTLWRGILNPTNPVFAAKIGCRVYCPILAVGNGMKISLSGFSDNVIDVGGGFLNNQSSLATNDYSVSRYGIIIGPSGQLSGNDHTIVSSGSGTNLVDAVIFIGARVAFDVSTYGQAGINAVNSYLGAGDTIRFTYTYSWTSDAGPSSVSFEKDIVIYQQGQIPPSKVGEELFPTPIGGYVASLVNTPETNTYSVSLSRDLTAGIWSPITSTATTGFSYPLLFTHSTNDYGYLNFTNNSVSK